MMNAVRTGYLHDRSACCKLVPNRPEPPTGTEKPLRRLVVSMAPEVDTGDAVTPGTGNALELVHYWLTSHVVHFSLPERRCLHLWFDFAINPDNAPKNMPWKAKRRDQ